jgi:hypothetical protein
VYLRADGQREMSSGARYGPWGDVAREQNVNRGHGTCPLCEGNAFMIRDAATDDSLHWLGLAVRKLASSGVAC